MKQSKRARWVRFVTVDLETTESPAFARMPERSLASLAAKVIETRDFGRKPKSGARVHVRIVDMELRAGFLVVLFREVDVDGQDAVYEDMESGVVDPHPKKPGQGNRATAHLVVDLNGKLSARGTGYDGLIEVVPGIGSGVAAARLRAVISKVGGGHGTVAGTDVEFRMNVHVVPRAEVTIRQELQGSVLEHFSLVHKSKPISQGFDEDHLIMDQQRVLQVTVAPGANQKLDKLLHQVKLRADKGHYEIVRAHYETPDGQAHTTPIDVHRADALEQMIAKQIRVELNVDANPDQTTVDAVIADAMIQAMKK